MLNELGSVERDERQVTWSIASATRRYDSRPAHVGASEKYDGLKAFLAGR